MFADPKVHLFVSKSEPWQTTFSFFLVRHNPGDLNQGAEQATVKFAKISEPTISNPTFVLEIDMAQSLMDNLWEVGLRPTQGSGSAGSLAATEKHLAHITRLLDVFVEKFKILS